MRECFGKMALDVTLFEDPYEAILFQKLSQEMVATVYITMTNFDLVKFLTENPILCFSFCSLFNVAKPQGVFSFLCHHQKQITGHYVFPIRLTS